MAGLSLSEQLRIVSDPRPAEFNPDEEDWELLSGARLTQSRSYEDRGTGRRSAGKKVGVASSAGRRVLGEECEADQRYAGRPVSRRELFGRGENANEEVELEAELESESDQSDEESGDYHDDRGMDSASSATESEEDDEVGGGVVKDGGGVVDEGERGEFKVLAMDKLKEGIEKGKAVREQIRLWDGVLEGRIRLHKLLSLTNTLPQSSAWPVFMALGGEPVTSSREQVQKELRKLLDSLLLLQQTLLSRHRDTQSLATAASNGEREEGDPQASSDEEIPSDLGSEREEGGESGEEREREVGSGESGRGRKQRRKRKCPWRTGGYEQHISALHAVFQDYREETVAKWDSRLRLATGRLTNKAFLQVDRSTVAQIKHVLEDKERLVSRSQLKRSVYRVLGEREETAEEEGESHDSHLRSHDEEIYDEDDFYHQLLKDLIERKMNYAESADPVAMGRQWLALQKLRSKVKKKVDTKASKGRKIRYDVHPKLVGFMAPIEKGDLSHSASTQSTNTGKIN